MNRCFPPTKPLLIAAALLSLFHGALVAAPAKPAPPMEPPELIALRAEYDTALAPLRAKVEEAIKVRSTQYAADLQKVEDQLTAASRFEGIPLVRAEREAFAAGSWTMGFGKDEKAAPPAARELRRAYDRDTVKIRADIVPAARPILNDYLRKLDELDKRLTNAKAVDSALAVREEKQGLQAAGADPLSGSNSLVVGMWLDEKGKDFEFSPSGTVPAGKWKWTDRPRRALRINWNAGPKFYVDLVISPDGNEMSGVNPNGGTRHFKRKRP